MEEAYMEPSANTANSKAQSPKKSYARIWLGGSLSGWLRMLAHNRFDVGVQHIPRAVIMTFVISLGSLSSGLQELIFGRRVRDTEIKQAPLFIIGHWRSGTTWLHELLALDDRFTYPTTYVCFNPNRFLLTERFDTHWLGFLFKALMPDRRPFDNMAMGWERPQEDEFALCNLGLPSPYQKIAFPNRNPYPEYFDLEGVPSKDLQCWKDTFLKFLKQLTVRNPKRILLKSPTHTYRIKVLLDLFPDARFVHIVRDPYTLFLSTMHMWKSLYELQGLQQPRYDDLEDYVFENFLHMFDKFEEARPLLDPSRFHELRYEELVRDPVGQLRRLYEKLELGDFEQVLPKLEQYLRETNDYRTNHYELTPELREKIARRWGQVMARYGYPSDVDSPMRKNDAA
jgi:hypothetical protein